MSSIRSIKRALISVSDKSGVVDLAKSLQQKKIEILSTGGTAKLLMENNIAVTSVSDYTGFPEMMDGRVKTLHPKIYGGILARRGLDDAIMQQHEIKTIDLLVVNLYPFESTIAKENCSQFEAIENIDIGGPTMLRAAAKNYADVTVIVEPSDYHQLTEQLNEKQGTDVEFRYQLACKVFLQTAQYDRTIAHYFATLCDRNISPKALQKPRLAKELTLTFSKEQDLRYGENPHQAAAFYRESNQENSAIPSIEQLQGKPLSFNNLADTDAALNCVKQFNSPACVIVKHANPCGVAVAKNIFAAYQKAFKTDPTSSFGGIIAFNREVDDMAAQSIINKQFVEVIVAPKFSEKALSVIAQKKNIRLLVCQKWDRPSAVWDFKKIDSGLLVQQKDIAIVNRSDLTVVTKIQPSEAQITDLLFCWKVAKNVKSNAIVYAKNGATLGIGAGQMSRVYSAVIAGIKANDENLPLHGCVMASDAFFPFRDGIDAAAKIGVSAVIQPGGSIRDEEIIAAADEQALAMVFTGMRHFKH